MLYLNKYHVAGCLTQNPDVRTTPGGTAIAEFCLAVNRKSKDQTETLFIDITAWGKTAEICRQYLQKGDNAYIEGRLTLDQWQGKDGQNRQKIKVTAESVQFISTKRGNAQQEQQEQPEQQERPQRTSQPSRAYTQQDYPGSEPDDDELPPF